MPILPTKTSLINIDLILEKAALKEGQKVADLGCGRSVFFLYALSTLVGKEGSVYGIDILPEVIDSATRDVIHHKLSSVKILSGDLEKENGIPLPDQSIEAAFLINTINQSSDTIAMLREAARILKKDGELIVVDWEKTTSPFGPNDSQRVAKEHLVESLELAGLIPLDHFAAGPYHYGIVIKKSN